MNDEAATVKLAAALESTAVSAWLAKGWSQIVAVALLPVVREIAAEERRSAAAVSSWFADVDHEAEQPYVWQPCLETGEGHIPCLQVWFSTRQECEDWIRQYVIGASLEADHPDYDERWRP